jgi:hypothetical protein
MDAIARRSRMRRTRTGKRIELSPRDLEIFRLLRRYRYLPSTYIHAFVGGASETRLKERLGDLFHEGYINRPEQQWQFANASHRPAVYESGLGTVRSLLQNGNVVDDLRSFLSTTLHRQFLHSLMICEVLASLDIAMRADPRLRFVGWSEILGRAPEATRTSTMPFRLPLRSGGYLAPDGLFGIEYAQADTKAYRFFALEADRGTMPVTRSNSNQTSFLGKLAAYREIIARQVHRTHWGIPNLLVLTVTSSETRLIDILSKIEGQIAGSAGFLFKAQDDFSLTIPAPQLFSQPWARAGIPPLRIDE